MIFFKILGPFIITSFMAITANAAIRVYDPPPPTKSSVPSQSTAPMMQPVSVKPASPSIIPAKIITPPTKPLEMVIGVFLSFDDLTEQRLDNYKTFVSLPELRALGAEVKVYMTEPNPRRYPKASAMFFEDEKVFNKLPENITVDINDENAKSLGINGKSTIVIKDETGAFRFYDLLTDVPKVERQLKRLVEQQNTSIPLLR